MEKRKQFERAFEVNKIENYALDVVRKREVRTLWL